MNRVYLSRRLGAGTEADPYRSELAFYVRDNFGINFHRQVICVCSPLVVSVYDTTDAQDTQITTNVTQVISINVPALDNTWGSLTTARRNTISNRLTGLGFTTTWITNSTTLREIVEFLAETLQLSEKLSIKLGVNRNAPDFQSTTRTVGNLTTAERTALQNVLAEEGQSTSLNNSDTLRSVCNRLRHRFIAPVINDNAQLMRTNGVNR